MIQLFHCTRPLIRNPRMSGAPGTRPYFLRACFGTAEEAEEKVEKADPSRAEARS